MPVDALELRPRNAVALFDAAVRLCATTSGVWALTLPAGAGLVAALFHLGEAIQHRRPLALPVLWWTLAWALRAISQGAACHHLEQQLLADEPPARRSFLAALRRAPGLLTASFVMLLLNTGILVFSAGLGFFFLGAHTAGYAAVMRGQGSALGVYGTASKLLGSARHSAPWVRLFGLTQLLLAANLQLSVSAGLYLARVLLGLDVSFLQRFTSPSNPLWLATVAAVTFALFEPVRAAAGTLLLIDGRVRQEGLDLLAAAEQLPRRRKRGGQLAVLSVLGLLSLPAHGAQPVERLRELVESCGMESVEAPAVDRARFVAEEDRQALERFVARLEHTAWDDEDCEATEALMREGLALLATESSAADAPDDPRALAAATLARPEFAEAPPTTVEPEAEPIGASLLSQWWEAIKRWLADVLEKARQRPPPARPPGDGSMAATGAVMVLAVLAVLALLAFILVRRQRADTPPEAGLDESSSGGEAALVDPESALARPPERWAGLADELAERGAFREAIRHLYLALLSRLHHRGAIDYDPAKSNWDYLAAFLGPAETKAAFRELTRRFDFAWYGNLDVSQSSWAAFRSVAEPVLRPAAAEGPR